MLFSFFYDRPLSTFKANLVRSIANNPLKYDSMTAIWDQWLHKMHKCDLQYSYKICVIAEFSLYIYERID